MKLSKSQFNKLLENNQLTLSLIGMSNMGKTSWSQKLRKSGFRHMECDALIEAKLPSFYKKSGYFGTKGMSKWLGQPYEDRYSANQKKYLALEKKVLRNIVGQVKSSSKNTVIDTTGSVIHTGGNICSNLKKVSLVVYFKATKKMRDEMFRRYMKRPKPVIFDNIFEQKRGEADMKSLERCYQNLLNIRGRLYTKYADITFTPKRLKKIKSSGDFLDLIRKSL